MSTHPHHYSYSAYKQGVFITVDAKHVFEVKYVSRASKSVKIFLSLENKLENSLFGEKEFNFHVCIPVIHIIVIISKITIHLHI
jgi:hypothetical protein